MNQIIVCGNGRLFERDLGRYRIGARRSIPLRSFYCCGLLRPRICSVIRICVRFAIELPNFGEYSDPHILAKLARETEDAGWDGCFIWDHIQVERSVPVADPWISLAAMAAATKRIRMGPLVTPLYRRHP